MGCCSSHLPGCRAPGLDFQSETKQEENITELARKQPRGWRPGNLALTRKVLSWVDIATLKRTKLFEPDEPGGLASLSGLRLVC